MLATNSYKMASKRSLYRPAPQENVGQKRNRKPLAQGRLVAGNDAEKKSHPVLVSGVEESTTAYRIPHSPYRSHVPEPSKAKQDSTVMRESLLTTLDQESFALTPRRNAPKLSEHTSPVVNKPARNLDLSDSDIDISLQYRLPSAGILKPISGIHKQSPGEVLVVDASRQTINPDESEVDIRVGYERSPARVVAHHRGIVESSLRPDVENIDPDSSDVSDVCSLNEYVTSKDTNTKKKVPFKEPTTGKKKKGRIVPSRYMQSAESKGKSLFNSDKLAKLDKSKGSRSLELSRKQIPTEKRTKSVSTEKRETPLTPENSGITTGGKTSTPTLDGSFKFPQEIDASAIHAETSVLSTGDVSKMDRTPGGSKRETDFSRSKVKDVHDPFSHSILSTDLTVRSENMSRSVNQKSEPSKVTQHDLDLLYMRYLQWVFLHSKAKKCREEQEKQAMIQINGLHRLVEEKRKKKHELDLELARLQHLNMLDELTDLQRQHLGPITNNLPTLTKNYENLAHALDTTRHQIPTKGVYLPDDEEQYQRKLEQELLVSENLLGELSVMTRQPLTTVTNLSKALNAMEKSVAAEAHELKGCREYLAAAKSLTVQETSLRIQAMQLKD